MATYAKEHNGGRIQIGLQNLFYSYDFPLINYMKGADGAFQVGGGVPNPTNLDSNGYPTAIVGGGMGWFFPLPLAADNPSDIIIDWDGNGSISLGGGVGRTFVSGSLTSSSGSGSYRFTPNNAGGGETLSITITAVGSPRITNIRCYSASEASRLAAGEIFGSKFLDRMMNELKPGVIRDLDWAEGNVNCITKASDLKPVGYAFYKGDEYRAAWWGGTSTLSRITYQVSAPSGFGALSNKNIVQYIVGHNSPVSTFANPVFTNGSPNIGVTAHNMQVNDPFFIKSDANSFPTNFPQNNQTPLYVKTVVDANTITASLTPGGTVITCGAGLGSSLQLSPCVFLQVGATAPKILLAHSLPMLTNDNTYPVAGYATTAIYDATLDMYIGCGGYGAYGNRGMCSGVPLEVFMQLCGQVGAHPHLIKEHLSCLPESDITTYKATYIRDNYNGDNTKLCPWMKPVFEPPNELWNTASDFWGTHYAYIVAAKLGTGWSYHEVYGMFLSTLAQAVNTVYSNDQTKYFLGCGVQTAGAGSTDWDPRITAAKWVATGVPVQSGYTAATAKNYGQIIVLPATYWNPYYYGNNDGTGTEADMITRWVAATDTNVKDQILEDYIRRALDATGWAFDVNGLVSTYWAGWKTYAIRNGLTRVRAYEGGISLDYSGSTDTRNFRNAAKGTKMAAAVEMAIMDGFVNLSGSGVTFEYPSMFYLSDGFREGNPKGSGWGLLNGGATIYGPVTHRYTAVCNWSGSRRVNNSTRLRMHN